MHDTIGERECESAQLVADIEHEHARSGCISAARLCRSSRRSPRCCSTTLPPGPTRPPLPILPARCVPWPPRRSTHSTPVLSGSACTASVDPGRDHGDRLPGHLAESIVIDAAPGTWCAGHRARPSPAATEARRNATAALARQQGAYRRTEVALMRLSAGGFLPAPLPLPETALPADARPRRTPDSRIMWSGTETGTVVATAEGRARLYRADHGTAGRGGVCTVPADCPATGQCGGCGGGGSRGGLQRPAGATDPLARHHTRVTSRSAALVTFWNNTNWWSARVRSNASYTVRRVRTSSRAHEREPGAGQRPIELLVHVPQHVRLEPLTTRVCTEQPHRVDITNERRRHGHGVHHPAFAVHRPAPLPGHRVRGPPWARGRTPGRGQRRRHHEPQAQAEPGAPVGGDPRRGESTEPGTFGEVVGVGQLFEATFRWVDARGCSRSQAVCQACAGCPRCAA